MTTPADSVVTVPVDMGKDLEPLDLDKCGHENLHFDLQTTRVCHEDGQHPHTLELEIRCKCTDCGRRLEFRGTPHAISFRRPCVDITATTLSVPMQPSVWFDEEDENAKQEWPRT